jgi:hypothetical protein
MVLAQMAHTMAKSCQEIQGSKVSQMTPKVFPTILMILDFCAAVPYAVQGDVKHTVY